MRRQSTWIDNLIGNVIKLAFVGAVLVYFGLFISSTTLNIQTTMQLQKKKNSLIENVSDMADSSVSAYQTVAKWFK